MANVAATAAPTGLPRLGAAGRTCRPVQLCATQRLSPSSVSLRVLRARGNPVGSRGPVPIRAQAAVADPAAPEAPTPVTKSREGGPPQTLEGSFIKKMLVVVAKFFISLLPGRLGLTWLAALLPSKVKAIFLSLFDNYVSEMVKAVRDRKRAEVVSMIVFKDMCKTYAEQMLLPYKFPSYHRAMRSPTDYYKMGQQYIGCLMDFERSILGYPERWTQVQEHISKGENVILLANHQSEGDAAFIPLMTEVSHPGLGSQVRASSAIFAAPASPPCLFQAALHGLRVHRLQLRLARGRFVPEPSTLPVAQVIYVAGDRVVSDKLCKVRETAEGGEEAAERGWREGSAGQQQDIRGPELWPGRGGRNGR